MSSYDPVLMLAIPRLSILGQVDSPDIQTILLNFSNFIETFFTFQQSKGENSRIFQWLTNYFQWVRAGRRVAGSKQRHEHATCLLQTSRFKPYRYQVSFCPLLSHNVPFLVIISSFFLSSYLVTTQLLFSYCLVTTLLL